MRYAAVEEATRLVTKFNNTNHIAETIESVRSKVYSWYSNTDVTDPSVLAGCVLMDGYFSIGISYSEMLAAKEFWFPTDTEVYNIWNIEAAQADSLYW